MVEGHEKPGDIAFEGGDARGGDDCQARFLGSLDGTHGGSLDTL